MNLFPKDRKRKTPCAPRLCFHLMTSKSCRLSLEPHSFSVQWRLYYRKQTPNRSVMRLRKMEGSLSFLDGDVQLLLEYLGLYNLASRCNERKTMAANRSGGRCPRLCGSSCVRRGRSRRRDRIRSRPSLSWRGRVRRRSKLGRNQPGMRMS